MPSSLHETLIELFRHRPSLAAELLGGVLGVEVPEHEQARLDPGELTELVPTEYRADAVVVLSDGRGPVLAVVVEVQLRRDHVKRWSWPVYLTTLRARLRCPAALLVVCVEPAVAAWCGRPIELGHPGARIAPLVIGPDRVPIVTDVAVAIRCPELSVLSALAHGPEPDGAGVLDAFVGALAQLDEQHATLYSDLVLAALPEAARRHLEDLMDTTTFEYRSEFVRKYVHQGRAEGRVEAVAQAVLDVLDARGLDVPTDVRNRIVACTDQAQLAAWLRRAATADAIERLLA